MDLPKRMSDLERGAGFRMEHDRHTATPAQQRLQPCRGFAVPRSRIRGRPLQPRRRPKRSTVRGRPRHVPTHGPPRQPRHDGRWIVGYFDLEMQRPRDTEPAPIRGVLPTRLSRYSQPQQVWPTSTSGITSVGARFDEHSQVGQEIGLPSHHRHHQRMAGSHHLHEAGGRSPGQTIPVAATALLQQ